METHGWPCFRLKKIEIILFHGQRRALQLVGYIFKNIIFKDLWRVGKGLYFTQKNKIFLNFIILPNLAIKKTLNFKNHSRHERKFFFLKGGKGKWCFKKMYTPWASLQLGTSSENPIFLYNFIIFKGNGWRATF